MHPDKVIRDRVKRLTDLPNVGPAVAADLRLIGIDRPQDLLGQKAIDLYRRLCVATGTRHDPCMLDTLMSVVAFMAGEPPRPWWAYTAERQQRWPTAAEQTGGLI